MKVKTKIGLKMDYTGDVFCGRVMKIEESSLAKEGRVAELEEQMKVAKEAGYYVRLGGFKVYRVKGLDLQNFNERTTYEDSYAKVSRELYDIWGDQYFGMQFGESDASYLNLSGSHVFPYKRTRVGQAIDFLDHYQWYGVHTGNRILAHHNETLWPYACNDSATTMGGAQTFYRGNTNPRIHFAFFRGMGKQYGLLWQGGVSGNNVWKSKAHEEELRAEIRAAGLPVEPSKDGLYPLKIKGNRARRKLFNMNELKGCSIGMLRRMTYAMYCWNGMFMDYEIGALVWGARNEAPKVSPTGDMFNKFDKFVKTYGGPGPMVTPVAFLTDYYAGWRVPNKERKREIVWNCLPYENGDYMLLNLFNVVYPNHFNLPLHDSKRYMLPDTPYGDIVDALTHDVRQEILDRYGLVVIGTELKHDIETTRLKLDRFVEQGGQVVITAANAAKLYPEWGITSQVNKVKSGSVIAWHDGVKDKEAYSFDLINASSIPADAKVLAEINGQVAAFEVIKGEGSISCVLSPYGLNNKRLKMNWPPRKKEVQQKKKAALAWFKNLKPLGYTHEFSTLMQKVLDAKLSEQRLFSVGEKLSHIVNYKGEKEYLLTIMNDTLESQPFEIVSHIGNVESIQEIDLFDEYLKQNPSFFPFGYQDNLRQQNDNEDFIMGSDVRIFVVKLKADTSRILPEIELKDKPEKRLIAVKGIKSLRHQLMKWPSYKRYLEGVNLTGQMLLDTSDSWLYEEAKIFNREKIRFVIDARDIVAVKDFRNLINKMSYLEGAEEIVVNRINDSVKVLLNNNRIRVIDAGSDIVFVSKADQLPADDFSGDIVLNCLYDNWDDLYHDIRIVWENDLTGHLRGEQVSSENVSKAVVKKANQNRFISLRGDIEDLQTTIKDTDRFFERFGGINLDSRYVFASSIDRVKADAAWLKEKKISVVVDFSMVMDNYKGVTLLKQQPYQYEWGKKYAKDVFEKMHILGAKQAVFMLMSRGKNDLVRDSLREFSKIAVKNNVQITLRTRTGLMYRKAVEVLDSLGQKNVKIACSTMTDKDPVGVYKQDKGKNISMILLSSAGKGLDNIITYPVSMQMSGEINVKELSKQKVIQVLDGEYLSNDELERDLEFMGW
ncbi:hypothetical protein JD969_17620 [Planctomycetota bacterium]|nr:hypothetical protein JD969_17620 [Planctomycetota bacterium]